MSKRDELRAKLSKGGQRQYAKVQAGGDEYVIRSLNLKEKGENDIIPINAKTGTINTAKLSQQKCDLLCRCVVDPDDRQPIFEPSEWEIWESVDAAVTSKLLGEIDKLNDGKDVDGLLGN